MTPRTLRHGCLVLFMAQITVTAAPPNQPLRVVTREFEIDYGLNEAAQPIESVQLWFTLDRGLNWQHFGFDRDVRSPVVFRAPTEGLYGFFVIVTNAVGPSSQPPGPSTKPMMWALVDYTAPVIQLHNVRQINRLGETVVQIDWTAIDTNLPTRPIEIFYQKLNDLRWVALSREPLPNTGRFDWRVPQNLTGPISVRIAVTDQGGHRVESESKMVDIPNARSGELLTNSIVSPLRKDIALYAQPASSRSATAPNVRHLFSEAMAYRDREQLRTAVSRLREVVRLDPKMTEAFTEMADILNRLGDPDRAMDAYGIALQQRPTMRAALKGTALIYGQRKDYSSAATQLRTILRYNPNDVEVWMNLGDLAIYQGDELLARECYMRASQMDPTASDIVSDARKRLTLLGEVSRTYAAGVQ